MLAEFRDWLIQSGAALAADSAGELAAAGEEPPDLHTLLGQMLALRQEVNLQTRASRSQQEQNAETLQQLSQALDALESRHQEAQDAQQQEPTEKLRPLLKVLVDIHDALSLAHREVQRLQDGLLVFLDQVRAEITQEPQLPRFSRWARWLGLEQSSQKFLHRLYRSYQERSRTAARKLDRVPQFLASVLTGYAMSLQRLQRALEQQGLEPIECLGEPFDPETMEVVEVVHEAGRSGSEVIEEVRRGYLWRNKVFRCALVRVAR